MNFPRVLMLAGGACLIALSTLSAQTRAVDRAAREGILLFGNGAEPATLDPNIATGVTENRIISALIEGLFSYHPDDQAKEEPGIAESWEHNEDASVWTFRLRDAKWSNGDPVRAQDFAYSARRILTPELGAQYADMLHIIRGAAAFHKGETTDFETVGVRVIDDRTLRYELNGPVPFFTSMLTHYSWFPVHPPTIEKHGGPTARFSPWTKPENFVGNGPFMLDTWSVNKLIRVVRSPTYWDAANVRLNEIHFIPIENTFTEEQSFRNGQLHVTSVIPADRIDWWRQNNPASLRLEPYLGTYFYRFNTTRKPLDDLRVRRALTLAIDQQAIVDTITRAGETPAYAFIPDGMGGYEPPFVIEFDPEEARRLLADAGFPNGRGFPRLDLLFNTQEAHRRIAEAVQAMWRTHLGIEISITNQEWKVYLDSQRTMNYDISRSGWIGDYMDPVTMLKLWKTGDGNNNTGWSNAIFDEAINASWLTGDPKKRYELLLKAEQQLLEELPIAPVYWYTTKRLADPRLRNFNPVLLDNRPWKRVYFEL
jgi:oligopeptide transport system substrate-binding protein